MKKMTSRERFNLWADYKTKDIPAWGDWIGPYDMWVEQGLPPMPDGETDKQEYLKNFFGHEVICSWNWGSNHIPVCMGIYPGYEVVKEEIKGGHKYTYYSDGSITKVMENKTSSVVAAEYIKYGLRGPENWEEYKKHLNPYSPERFPEKEKWEELRRKWGPERDEVLTVDAGSFYGTLRNWMGVENASYALYDEPEWVAEVMDYLADFYIEILKKVLKDFKPDAAIFWEDICYKNGPLISPEHFKKFCLEPYKRVTSFLKENGVNTCFVDCDGNIDALVPIWIEGGVRGFYPLEVAADCSAERLLREYQKDKILLWGNVDKRRLTEGHGAIEKELERLAPAVEMGGFIPLVDHGVHEYLNYEDYCYYHRRRKEKFNITNL